MAPVPAPVAVLEGATPEEQPVKPATAVAVIRETRRRFIVVEIGVSLFRVEGKGRNLLRKVSGRN